MVMADVTLTLAGRGFINMMTNRSTVVPVCRSTVVVTVVSMHSISSHIHDPGLVTFHSSFFLNVALVSGSVESSTL